MSDPVEQVEAEEESWSRNQATVQDPTGLHARPAVKLTKLSKSFEARVEIRAGTEGAWVNAKSPNAVMKLKVAHGEVLSIRAQGEQADAAVDALAGLVERDFND